MEGSPQTLYDESINNLKLQLECSRIVFYIHFKDLKAYNVLANTLVEYLEKWEKEDNIKGIIFNFKDKFVLFYLEGSTLNLYNAIESVSSLYESKKKDPEENMKIRIVFFSDLHRDGLFSFLVYVNCTMKGKIIENSNSDEISQVWKFYEIILNLAFRTSEYITKAEVEDFLKQNEGNKLAPDISMLDFIDSEDFESVIWNYSEFRDFFIGPFNMKLDSEYLKPENDKIDV